MIIMKFKRDTTDSMLNLDRDCSRNY